MYPISKKRIKRFNSKYAQIHEGMTRDELINIMGSDFNVSLVDGYEHILWKCKGYSAFERELLAKKSEEFFCAEVTLNKNVVISYQWIVE